MSDADQNLIEYLAEHDSSCPQCSYNLRGTIKYQCSECGLEFEGYNLDKLLTLRYESVDERRVIRVAQFVLVCWFVLIPLIIFEIIRAVHSYSAEYLPPTGATPQASNGSWEDLMFVVVALAIIFADIGLLILLQRGRRSVTVRRQQKTSLQKYSWVSTVSCWIIILCGLPLVLVFAGVVWVIWGMF